MGDSLLQDLRYALRTFRKSPGFAAVAVLTIGLGIGGSTAIFTVVNSVILKPLPYHEPDRLVYMNTSVGDGGGRTTMGASPGVYRQLQAMPHLVDDVALYNFGDERSAQNLTGGGEPEPVVIQRVTRSLFHVLGVRPIVGRSFLPSDVAPGTDSGAFVILSHGLWARRYGSDPSIVGGTILINDRPREVIGVMPKGFAYPTPKSEVWISTPMSRTNPGGWVWRGVARLKPGISIEEATLQFNIMMSGLPEAFPSASVRLQAAIDRNIRLEVEPLKDSVMGDVRQTLWVVFGAVTFVLLMACANVANLFLVRAEARRREIAVRSAVGAARGRLARHFVAEGITISALGGVLGLGLAIVTVRVLVRLDPTDLPRLHEISVDPTVVIFALAAALISGASFGTIAVTHCKPGVLLALKERALGSAVGRSRFHTRNVLVASQVAFALMLLVGSGLMIRSFLHLTRVDLGFDPTDVLTFELRVDSEYSTREGIIAFHNDLLDRLSGLPGVEAVGAAACVPFKGQCAARSGGSLERDAPRDEGRNVQMRNMVVSASYFETMRMELLAGRLLEPGPADSLSIVISAAAAEDRWPGEDPLGRVVWFGNPTREPPPPQWHTVVGVVADVPVSAVTGDRRVNYRIAYYPEGAPRCCVQTMTVAMRTSTPPLDLIEAVRSTVRSMDASLPMGNIRTMEDYLASARAPMVFTMVVLIVGGMVALLLGVIGIYGVISYVVGRRGTEIGIRMAVGATAADVKAMVLRQGGSVIVVGVLLGLLGAFALTRMMESVIFGVSPTDPATYVAASVGLLVIALLATYLPARRAARVDPVEALRAD